MAGRFRTLKFRINNSGNPAYEALKNLNGISVTILKENENWCFEQCFRVVDFEDFGVPLFDPDRFGGNPEPESQAEGGQ